MYTYTNTYYIHMYTEEDEMYQLEGITRRAMRKSIRRSGVPPTSHIHYKSIKLISVQRREQKIEVRLLLGLFGESSTGNSLTIELRENTTSVASSRHSHTPEGSTNRDAHKQVPFSQEINARRQRHIEMDRK